jgi:threonine aldolase
MAYTPIAPAPNAPPIRINLYSDTQTRPTPAMKEAMMAAEVGDEQHGNDPTVHELCGRVADLLGKEAAVYLPSGTMGNVIAILVHCRPGDEVVAHETSHILTSEGGAHAALAGVQIMPLKGPRGTFTVETLQAALRPLTRHAPEQRLLSLEQTANIGGGAVWPVEQMAAVTGLAKDRGWAVHMDGARLMNAVVATGIPAREYAGLCDSVWIDFTKGLGAPLGAVLAGSQEFIDRAWRWKQRIGGSMRQAGLCAAGCIHALDHHVDRLADDHANARRLAEGLAKIPGIAVEAPDTNLVYFDPAGAGIAAEDLASRLRHRGIHISMLANRIRACTHLDVDAGMIDEALAAIAEITEG